MIKDKLKSARIRVVLAIPAFGLGHAVLEVGKIFSEPGHMIVAFALVALALYTISIILMASCVAILVEISEMKREE